MTLVISQVLNLLFFFIYIAHLLKYVLNRNSLLRHIPQIKGQLHVCVRVCTCVCTVTASA